MKSFYLFSLFFVVGFSAIAQSNATTTACKDAIERVRKNCIVKEVKAYVDANYDIAKVANFAKIGDNKIYTQFKVTETAEIIDIKVKATAPELENEAIRVVQSFPNLIPGEEAGTGIDPETFNLLIVFNVDEDIIKLSAQRITGND